MGVLNEKIISRLLSLGSKKNLKDLWSVDILRNNGMDEIPLLEQLAIVTHWFHLQDIVDSGELRTISERIISGINQFAEKESQKVCKKTIIAEPSPFQLSIFQELLDVPYPSPENYKFTFIDLFAGMGGFRLAMQAQGGKCVFSSEYNQYSQKTYFANFGEVPFGDITKESTKLFIPDKFDVLCAGFPCQPFSIAGVSKKRSLGREDGFRDKTQGTLFFEVADIIERHKPKAFFLENVKNLVSHDKGNTFKVIKGRLEELGYSIHYKVMDGKAFVPQHRERIMLIGFQTNLYKNHETFEFPCLGEPKMIFRDILDPEVADKYTLSDKLWMYLQNYAAKHKAAGNGFGFGMTDLDGISRTLSARYYKDGSEILVPQGESQNPRRLTPRECARLMGYDDKYIISAVSEIQAYRQCGNSVIVPLITAVAKNLVESMINDQIYE